MIACCCCRWGEVLVHWVVVRVVGRVVVVMEEVLGWGGCAGEEGHCGDEGSCVEFASV